MQQQLRDNRIRARAHAQAEDSCNKLRVDPLRIDHTPVQLFAKQYNLKPRAGSDDKLRDFPDAAISLPPVNCLLQGCETVWMNNLEEFQQHCDQVHGGVQAYRLRCLHLLSRQVWQVPGSISRAALSNFAEFQTRSATQWQNFSPHMREQLEANAGELPASDRWSQRRWLACVVCAEGRWSEDLVPTFLAGEHCNFKKPDLVANLLDADKYIETWPCVPSEEVLASSVEIALGGAIRRLLLHKRRVSPAALRGEEAVNMCADCHACLVKAPPEMPTRALANGKWLGRHPEIMRQMPFGHRLLLPVSRVIATKIIFTSNPKNPWERTHSSQGIHGVTTIVEQAPVQSAVREYPPDNLADSFEAVFTGLDPDDTRKAQILPIQKKLLLQQMDFLMQYSAANQDASYKVERVNAMVDGETPSVIAENFADVPRAEDVQDVDSGEEDNASKYLGPVDSTVGAQELGEQKDGLPFTYLCHDTVPLDKSTCWHVAAAKMSLMERQAQAVLREEELSVGLECKAGRGRLLQTATEFREAVRLLSAAGTKAHLESIMQNEPAPVDAPSPEQTAPPDEPPQDEPQAAAWSGASGQGQPRLIVPTRKKYADMWQSKFWQEWNPMDWCYGDCVYGDPKLNEAPYKQTSYQDWCKHVHLREELEYDMYPGENYTACHYGQDHWQQQPNVEKLLAELEQSVRQEVRKPQTCTDEIFGVNRFRRNHACRMVLATFWRLMSGFMAVNVGLRIPGVQGRLKALADLPEQLQILSAKSSDQDGMASLIRRAVHLFDLISGKVVGSNGS